MQQKALDWRRDAYLQNKWAEVVVLEQGQRFDQWAHERTPKTKGGNVFVTVSVRGEVEFFEGWLPRAAAKKAKKVDGKTEKEKQAERPAMTQATENYLELHRQAAVRLALIAAPGTALRLLVAHAVASSGNWSVRGEAQRSHSNAIKASVEQGAAQKAFEGEREKVEKLLDVPDNGDSESRTVAVFIRLLALKDAQVQRIAAFVMAETLAVGSVSVEAAGSVLEVDASKHWQPDDTFFDLVREKPTLTAMVAQVAGKDVAKINAGEKAVTQKQIIRDALAGRNGRKKADTWLPDWMAFPFKPYGGGVSDLAEMASEAKKLLRKA
jgi:ParB family chromosome partitioning protein